MEVSKMTNIFIILSLMIVLTTAEPEQWFIPVLLPKDNICVQKAIQLAFKDIGNGTIYGKDGKRNYTLNPEFHSLGRDIGKVVEVTNQIHSFSVTKQHLSPIPNIKRVTIGPPYPDQTALYGEFAQLLPTIQVAYNEIPEPHEESISLRVQTPPSIAGLIRTSRKFLEAMNWNKVVLVYDFSNSRYRHAVNTLEEHITQVHQNKSIKVVYKARIRSEATDIRVKSLLTLPHLDARIVFLMVSVPGARRVFCQAFHLELYKSSFTWILFEKLPNGWASEEYDPIDEETGERKREIDCTEEEILSVTRDYIYIVRGGLRRDDTVTANGKPASEFPQHFKNYVQDPILTCGDEIYYAYDSVWLSKILLQNAISYTVQDFQGRTFTFEDGFLYARGFIFIKKFTTDGFDELKMEGLTGLLSFKYETLFNRRVRKGLQSLFHHTHGQAPTWIGNFDNINQSLNLVPNAIEILFGNEGIPSDKARYFYIEYKFPEGYVIAIWTLAILGILLIICLAFMVSVCHPKNADQVHQTGLHWTDLIILFGCIICFISLIVYGLDTRFLTRDQYKNGCYGFLSTLSFGFSLTFGALFAKIWWKYKSFNAPSVQNGKREFSEWFMFILISFFVLVDVIVISSWAKASPFTYIVSNPTNRSLTFGTAIEEIVKCDGQYQAQFTIGLFCYKGVLLVFGVFLAWQTANRLHKKSSRSKSDSMAIFNTALVSIVGVVCVSLLEDTAHRHALYVILAICVILCTGSIAAVVFAPKISHILYPFGSDSSSQGSTDQENNKTSFTKFTLELRRRVTGKNGATKFPSVSSVATSQISISTATSSIDSRKNMIPGEYSTSADKDRQGSFLTETSSQPCSLVSYNPTFSSPHGSETILEVPGGEEDIIATHPTPKEGSSICSDDIKLQNEDMPQMSYRNQGFMDDGEQDNESLPQISYQNKGFTDDEEQVNGDVGVNEEMA
ncbi:gamma-aminobutyric acid type B receptor subunit 2-like [Clytia hemisphaerica]|uniref:G-protein coupled receptors family 3 profile domain-containing protein n=1 Tax=Clytia hemisphaerica TaxID=252671 RepID=A0A7M5WT45_9CNID|eukprot:TCONS_00033334-protein